MQIPSLALLLAALVTGIVLGGVVGYLAATARSASAHASGADAASRARTEAAQWQARAEELAARAEVAEERADRDASVLRALAPVRAQLEQVGARVEAMERERASQHAQLAEQLRAGALTERELSRTTAQLASALRSRSSRGMWGEAELARVLEASGMLPHVDFTEQRSVGALLAQRAGRHRHAGGGATTGGGTRRQATTEAGRPDVVVHLPGDGYLALDAKAPMDAYMTALDLADSPQQEQAHAAALRDHAQALRRHVDALAGRGYDRALGRSPELVVLFVPAEAVLAAALEADPTLMDHAMSKGVALTSPSSLLALLRVCATAWARAAVHEDAEELLELGRTLYERLGTVASHLDTLGGALTRSVSAYNRTVASLESRLLVTARSFESLGTAGALSTPRQVEADAAQVRRLTAPELTQDDAS